MNIQTTITKPIFSAILRRSHPKVVYKRVALKNAQNSFEKNCDDVSI